MRHALVSDVHVFLVGLGSPSQSWSHSYGACRLPTSSGEKVTLGLTCFVAFSVFMLMVAEKVPATSDTVPIIGIYLTIVMSLTVGAMNVRARTTVTSILFTSRSRSSWR
jgi:hypothetical protein